MGRREVGLKHKGKIRNKLFGYASFVALYYLVPFHCTSIVIISKIVSITSAYLYYKFLVVRKFYLAYGWTMIMGIRVNAQ